MTPRSPLPARWLALLLVLCQSACTFAEQRVLYQKKSDFNHVIVREDADGVRYLMFEENGATQTAVDTRDPQRLVISYTRTAMLGLAVVPRPQRMLMVGLGGGAMPMFLRRNFPDADIDVAELDPEVAHAARTYFGFREDDRMKIHIGDGRKFIEQIPHRYDIIFLDAFGTDSIPYSLATREFLLAVRSKLTEDGIVVANVWGAWSNRLYHSMIKTYRDVFPEMHIVHSPASENRIFMVLPTRRGLSERKLIQLAEQIQDRLHPPLPLAQAVRYGYEVPEPDAMARVLLDANAPRD